MSKHTPGLWTYSYTSAAAARAAANDGTDGGGGNGLIMARQPGQDRIIVAFLPHHRDPSEDEEREANACLLATAPKMLELIIKLAAGYDSPKPKPGDDVYDENRNLILECDHFACLAEQATQLLGKIKGGGE